MPYKSLKIPLTLRLKRPGLGTELWMHYEFRAHLVALPDGHHQREACHHADDRNAIVFAAW